jgi:hypothetical protein
MLRMGGLYAHQGGAIHVPARAQRNDLEYNTP